MAEEPILEYLKSDLFVQASTNSTRLVAKLESALQRKEFYESHQILRTIYSRFTSHKEKLKALEHLLYLATILLLKLNESISGQDVAILYLETVAKYLNSYREESGNEAKLLLTESSIFRHRQKETLDLELSLKVAQIASLMPDVDVGKSKFLADILRILNSKVLNSNLLQNSLASELFRANDFHNSKYLYVHSAFEENINEVADLLVACHRLCGDKIEADLLITQFIFQFLSLQNPTDPPSFASFNKKQSAVNNSLNSVTVTPKTRSAIKCIADGILRLYAQRHPSLVDISWPYKSYPLLNFTHFIIAIINSNDIADVATFKTLCETYQAAWFRDKDFSKYLDRIGTIYFGIVDESKQRQGGGFFNNVLMSLLEGADDEDDGEDDDSYDKKQTNQAGNLSSSDELD